MSLKESTNYWGTQTYNSEKNFSQWSRKGKVKGAKILPYFTLDLYTKEPIYHRPYQGNSDDILRTWKMATGKLVR
nr:hypothetical protein [Mycoplasmopsis bovis]